jgi:hypothetical protein
LVAAICLQEPLKAVKMHSRAYYRFSWLSTKMLLKASYR